MLEHICYPYAGLEHAYILGHAAAFHYISD
jgi:hypothetical protein